MKITPKKESEISKGFEPLPTGTYPFTVLESDVAIAKSDKNKGKEMVKLKLNVHGRDFDKHVYDHFADWFSEWKLKHFFDTTGHASEYEAGDIDPSGNAYNGWTGFVKIGIEANKETGEERNNVLDYVVQKVAVKPVKMATNTAHQTPENNDDVPF